MAGMPSSVVPLIKDITAQLLEVIIHCTQGRPGAALYPYTPKYFGPCEQGGGGASWAGFPSLDSVPTSRKPNSGTCSITGQAVITQIPKYSEILKEEMNEKSGDSLP